jgi:ceramide glucosyltransferase
MNPNDPAIPVIKELVDKYHNRARLCWCLEVCGINYQISNLMHLLKAAQHELIVFTDSDVYALPHYLKTVISPLADPSIGLVTCSYGVKSPKFLIPALVGLGRCIDNIPSVLLARQMNGGSLWFAFGATMATRKSVLAQVGGLESVVDRIGTDYFIGNMVLNAGYRVELSQYILETDDGSQSFQQLFQRELRWAITIRRTQGLLYYGNAFTYGTVYSIALVLLTGFQSWSVIVLSIAVAVRIIQALVAIYSIGYSKLLFWLWALPLRDLLSFILFIGGAFGSNVYWRGRRLQIGKSGILKEQES